jgi:hypothetical protein
MQLAAASESGTDRGNSSKHIPGYYNTLSSMLEFAMMMLHAMQTKMLERGSRARVYPQ